MEINNLLENNTYPGRGIVIGMSEDKKNAVIAYFIMGRSENSRNRIFATTEDGIKTEAFDSSKLIDPSLVIYNPVRRYNNKIIVTNGDQTDTIYDFFKAGETFEDALETRCYEPDAPNFTPRISGVVELVENSFRYKLSILKKSSLINNESCNRFYYSYSEPISGYGHFIHTYKNDGNPIPSFVGEPLAVKIPNKIQDFVSSIWNSLNFDNKVSLFVNYIPLDNEYDKIGKFVIVNKSKDE